MAAVVPPGTTTDLRSTLTTSLAECAELGAEDATAKAALATAQRDVDAAQAVLAKFGILDDSIARHLAGLAKAGTGGAGRSQLPEAMVASRRAQQLAQRDAADAAAVLTILEGEAGTAATALDRAMVAAGNLVDALASLEAVRVIDRMRALEREAGGLRILASAVADGRRLGAAATPWAVTSAQHDPWHGMLVEQAGDVNARGAAAAAAWQDFKTRLMSDPLAEFAAGPAA